MRKLMCQKELNDIVDKHNKCRDVAKDPLKVLELLEMIEDLKSEIASLKRTAARDNHWRIY